MTKWLRDGCATEVDEEDAEKVMEPVIMGDRRALIPCKNLCIVVIIPHGVSLIYIY